MAGTIWLVLSGIPTDIIDTPLFVRMTPVRWWDYPFWVAGAVLVGLLAATYVADPGRDDPGGSQGGKAVGGGLLTVFAVGCPVCNKLVVLALGAGGAMTYFALQLIREANYRITYYDLHRQLRDLIAADYSQDPQLEGTEENKQRQIFT